MIALPLLICYGLAIYGLGLTAALALISRDLRREKRARRAAAALQVIPLTDLREVTALRS